MFNIYSVHKIDLETNKEHYVATYDDYQWACDECYTYLLWRTKQMGISENYIYKKNINGGRTSYGIIIDGEEVDIMHVYSRFIMNKH